ncbi:hypothetical protein JD844_022858 [Phrynosoma platyrhinos]|uniref:Rap guanine nucleotide exchange factor 4 n=1 Tax=Phrynosoma platyrhinos TaxID=52577 RepID=A0ABQ7SVS5_PHRPL|nr:hypothetical protein JD844_022858 [Phrynosoma platyrhinos]
MGTYHAQPSQGTEQEKMDYALNNKRRVIRLVLLWAALYGDLLQEDEAAMAFLEEFYVSVSDDTRVITALKDQLPELEKTMKQIVSSHMFPFFQHKVLLQHFNTSDERTQKRQPIRGILFKVYCIDHTYTTIRIPVLSSVKEVISAVADKLGSGDGLILVKMSSGGEKVLLKPNDVSVFTTLSVNGRLFACPRDQFDTLTPLQEQEGPSTGTVGTFELMSSKDLAYQMTIYEWELFNCVHELELVYHTFGRHNFRKTTANLDLFLRRFNEIQFWVVTEICLCSQLSKRVQLLKKFIKIAAHCKEYKNLNSFFALIMGLSNVAVSRLTMTWEKLPSKFKKIYAEFESLMDPSRNHRPYRLTVAKLEPPVIPFMPLLIKDMTFTHEGNKTFIDNLVNFEKMGLSSIQASRQKAFRLEIMAELQQQLLIPKRLSVFVPTCSLNKPLEGKLPRTKSLDGNEMLAAFGAAFNTSVENIRILQIDLAENVKQPVRMISNTVRTVKFCRSQPFNPDASLANKNHQDVRSYVRQLSVIDNQRTLSQMSHRLEPRRA